jgi:hypothetical protein
MAYKAKCWVTDRWVKFTLTTGSYENIMVFLDAQKLLFLSDMELDFTTIPLVLHGRGYSKNLREYIANNDENTSLINRFIDYFLNIILDISYLDGSRVYLTINPNPDLNTWQSLEIIIHIPEVTTNLTVDSTLFSVDDTTITSDQTVI